jgi:hypothetical protein
MFWGCFSWDKKGPYHMWKKETAQEKKQADQELLDLNTAFEPILRTEWELNNEMRRINLRRRPAGKKPIWRFIRKTGKLTRGGKAGGINWYRYWKLILLLKLIPFAKECLQDRSDTVVQEDNAGPHSHPHQNTVYALHDVTRLLWPDNSPDLNAIEPAWYWLKRRTTAQGAPANRKDMEQAWRQA